MAHLNLTQDEIANRIMMAQSFTEDAYVIAAVIMDPTFMDRRMAEAVRIGGTEEFTDVKTEPVPRKALAITGLVILALGLWAVLPYWI